MTSHVLLYVRETATRLVDELTDAERRTGGWSNQALGQRLVSSALDRCLEKLAATGLAGRDNQLPSSELWKIAGHLLEHGQLQLRARSKPRGYAGDDEMLEQIFRHECCDHPLGQLFDEYFQSRDAPEAVRGRIRLAAQAISQHAGGSPGGPYHLVSVGSGPALDVQLALEGLPPSRRREVRVTLLDLDQQALDAATQNLAPHLPVDQLRCRRENLFRLPRRATRQPATTRPAAPLAEADFILCLGFLDYLEAADAEAMLRLFWENLQPGGCMLVGNFAPQCTARPYMEWIGNWYLIYRTSDEFAALAAAAGIPPNRIAIDAEPLGVDLILWATKTQE